MKPKYQKHIAINQDNQQTAGKLGDYKPYLAIDRDGCLVGNLGDYRNNSPSQYKSQEMPLITPTIRQLQEIDIPVIIISNQAGIEKGYVSYEQVVGQFIWLMDTMAKEGITCIGSMFCPDYAGASCHFVRAGKLPITGLSMVKTYTVAKVISGQAANFRKPGPGMGVLSESLASEYGCDSCFGYVGDLSGIPGYAPTSHEPASDKLFAESWGVPYYDINDFLAL